MGWQHRQKRQHRQHTGNGTGTGTTTARGRGRGTAQGAHREHTGGTLTIQIVTDFRFFLAVVPVHGGLQCWRQDAIVFLAPFLVQFHAVIVVTRAVLRLEFGANFFWAPREGQAVPAVRKVRDPVREIWVFPIADFLVGHKVLAGGEHLPCGTDVG